METIIYVLTSSEKTGIFTSVFDSLEKAKRACHWQLQMSPKDSLNWFPCRWDNENDISHWATKEYGDISITPVVLNKLY